MNERPELPREPPAWFAPGVTLVGRYRLGPLLGRGGMGVVHRARDQRLERDVAVKVLAAASAAARERFLREARVVATLNHPHIVAIHDVDEHDGTPFLVMELVEGGSLADRVGLELEQGLVLARQVCAALEHAHAAGIVHRDVKPGNVLLARRGPAEDGAETSLVAKLADLGLAVVRGSERVTEEGTLAGSPEYMAPEQALGKAVDGRADLYALGVMLYELATGTLPFTANDALAMVSQHVHAPLVPPRARRPELSFELDALIVRLLAKSPAARFESAAALGAALDALPAVFAPEDAVPPVTRIDSLARGRLIGRDRELGELREAWEGARETGVAGVLLAGEPGAGKSRLALELANHLQVSGTSVLWGGCYELEATTPYLPFVEALRHWVHEAADDELRATLADGAPDLARLAPEIESRLGALERPPALGASEERLRLFDHFARFLERDAEPRGVLLVVDDLQWADAGTLGLVHYLLRRPFGARLLVLATYRAGELDEGHVTARQVAEWERQRLLRRVPVERLTEDSTAELLAALLGQEDVAGALAAGIHAETEGNPFFVEEVVKSLVDAGQLVREGGVWRRGDSAELVLPPSVKATIERRFERVSEATLGVLRIAAVLGKSFAFELLARAVGDEDAALEAIEEAERTQLVRASGEEGFVFTHDKIREVLYESINRVRRRRVHAGVAGALEALRAEGSQVAVEDLAHHCVRAADSERGLAYALEAATEARAVFALEEEVRLLQDALGCAEALDRSQDVARVEARLARANESLGDLRAAVRHWLRARDLEPDPARRRRNQLGAAEALTSAGDVAALPLVEEVLEEPGADAAPTDAARARMVRGRFMHLECRSADAAVELEAALELARRGDDEVLPGTIVSYVAGAWQHVGDFALSDARAEECRAIGERLGNPLLVCLGDEFLAENAFAVGDWRRAIEYAEREAALAARVHSGERLAWSCVPKGGALLELDRLDEAARTLREGALLGERAGDLRVCLLLGFQLALARAEEGRAAEALRAFEHWKGRTDTLELLSVRLWSLGYRAQMLARLGRPREAAELALECEALVRPTQERWIPMQFGAELSEACTAAGRLDVAERWADWALELALRCGSTHYSGCARVARARLRAARGEADAARAELAAGRAELERAGSVRALRHAHIEGLG